MSQNNRTWRDNAAEFAALDRGEGWQFAILVACSVERRVNQRASTIVEAGKVSIAEFAREAGTSDVRVARYLDAWQQAADKGWVQDAATLTPAMSHDLTVPDRPWRAKDGGVYDASKTGGQINNTEQIAAKAAKDPEYAKRVLGAVAAAAAPEVKREAFTDLSSDQDVTGDAGTRRAAGRNIDAASAASEFNLRNARATERDEAERKSRGDLRAIEADVALVKAKRLIREAVNTIHDASLSEESRDLLVERFGELARLVALGNDEARGTGAVDWDQELASLMGGDA